MVCPLTNEKLVAKTVHSENVGTDTAPIEFIKTGYLVSNAETFYPIIDGVPRMLPNSFIEHKTFFDAFLPDNDALQQKFAVRFQALLNDFYKKSGSTKKSFTKEWTYLGDKDNIWNYSLDEHKNQVFKEFDIPENEIKDKLVLDIGCGHGRCSNFLNAAGAAVIAIDLTPKIVEVAKTSPKKNLLFVQADIQYLPIQKAGAAYLYSSGVLHHTFSTYQSFLKVECLLEQNGKICLFLYHPRKSFVHNIMRGVRRVTKNLPISLQYFLYRYIFCPVIWVLGKLLNKKVNLPEAMVNLTDFFSPQYRWEHTEAEVKEWLATNGFVHNKITTRDTFGFSIIGQKTGVK